MSSCPCRIISKLSQKRAVLLIYYLRCAAVALLPGVQQGVAAARAHVNDFDGARRLREAAGLSPVHEVGQLVHAAVTEELWEGLTSCPGVGHSDVSLTEVDNRKEKMIIESRWLR